MNFDRTATVEPAEARADSVQRLVGASCVSCGAPAVLKNYDGEYCQPCMKLHLIEKMFVNLTALQGKRHE
jgi:hypothetical protein